jgi:sulfofructose kinase
MGSWVLINGIWYYSYLINPFAPWDDHFRFARAASAHAIQHLGNETSLPTLDDVYEVDARFDERPAAASPTT